MQHKWPNGNKDRYTRSWACERDGQSRMMQTGMAAAAAADDSTHICTSRVFSRNSHAWPRAISDRGWGRDHPLHAWTFHGSWWFGVAAPTTEFPQRSTMLRRASRATWRTIGGRATRATTMPHHDWRTAPAADLNRSAVSRRSRTHYDWPKRPWRNFKQQEIKPNDWSSLFAPLQLDVTNKMRLIISYFRWVTLLIDEISFVYFWMLISLDALVPWKRRHCLETVYLAVWMRRRSTMRRLWVTDE